MAPNKLNKSASNTGKKLVPMARRTNIFQNFTSSDSSEEECQLNREQSPDKCSTVSKVSQMTTKRRFSTVVFGKTDEERTTEPDNDNEMSKMLSMFSTDVNKALLAKRKRLEQYSEATIQASQLKIEQMCRSQATETQRSLEEMRTQLTASLDQCEKDIKHSEEQVTHSSTQEEDKIKKVTQQQIKVLQQSRTTLKEKLSTLRELCASISEKSEEQETKQKKEYEKVQTELTEELTSLQRKLMTEIQKEELAIMQKSLQKAFFM
uniref:XLR/SYCP3/FAM9 domain-containing protein n=1 Tax=Timema poppense TaxID=170557 RepID=A0A7R9CYC9_TIMPO|nr:unnamed protein product [Timema poppensis]